MPNAVSTIRGLIQREWAFQSKFFTQRLQRILLGPIASAFTAYLLYGGLFRNLPELRLGEISAVTYRRWLFSSFLLHSFLNQGYYFFSNKLLNEWWSKTLGLLWMSPAPSLAVFLGLSALEFLRGFFLTLLLGGLLTWQGILSFEDLALLFAAFPAVLGLGLALGALKGGIAIWRRGKGEVFDPLFWALLFTSCFYVPRSLLPPGLTQLAQFNPLYYWQRALLSAPSERPLALFVLWLSFIFVLALTLTLKRRLGSRLLEKGYC